MQSYATDSNHSVMIIDQGEFEAMKMSGWKDP